MIAMLVTLKMFSMLGAHVLDVPKSDQLDVNGSRGGICAVEGMGVGRRKARR